jgi:hypothetical protein
MTANNTEIYTRKDRLHLGLILLLAVLHGLLYVFLLPLWQHYDEPNHFERVWLQAELGRQPQEEDQDSQFNRTVMESMIRTNFFRGVDYIPPLDETDEPLRLFGYSQLDNPPLYYWIASIPIGALDYLPVEQQLIIARLVSLALLLVTILAAWGIACQLTDAGHPLRWMLPLTLALLPGFVELMTAVNNDAAAIAVFSLFLWASVCVLRNDVTVFNLMAVLGTAGLTYFAKSTAMIALLIAPFVLLFAFTRGSRRKIAWIASLVGLLFAVLISLRWGDAAGWYRGTSQKDPNRVKIAPSVVGEAAFFINSTGEVPRGFNLFQVIPEPEGQSFGGKEVALGGWIWASQPVEISTPILTTASQSNSQPISVNQSPQFFAFSTVLPEGTDRIWIRIAPKIPGEARVDVFYDGLFLVEGSLTSQTKITYKDINANQIGWDESIKDNYIKNGSAERAGLRLHPLIDKIGSKILPDRGRVSYISTSFFDRAGSSDLYQKSLARLFRTFWAEFGWGHISLSPAWLYVLLFAVMLIGIVGFVINMLRTRRYYPWDVMFIFGLALVLSWGMTFVRGAIYLDLPGNYVPVARYSYPVIIPTMLIFVQAGLNWEIGCGVYGEIVQPRNSQAVLSW